MTSAAVILAAGFSTRMGADNKLLLEIEGVPVLRRVVDAVCEATDEPPLVVLGHEADRVRDVLDGAPVKVVVNSEPDRGQPSSVRLGLEKAADADVTLVVLGDQPFLTSQALTRLIDAHRTDGHDLITVPMRGNERGNPIALPRRLRQAILADGTKIGCGSFTRKHPELTRPFETTEDAFFRDVDTPDDLAKARADFGKASG